MGDKVIDKLIRDEIVRRMYDLFDEKAGGGGGQPRHLSGELATCESECLPAILDSLMRMEAERAELLKHQYVLLTGLLKVKQVEFVPDEEIAAKD